MERETREDEDEFLEADSVSNEGLIFYHEVSSALLQSACFGMFWFEKWLNQTNLFVSSWQKIQPVDSEYKEGREYVLQHFIKEGSYGEVHSAEDVNSGFKFAAKKVIYSISICIKTVLYKSMYIILVFYVPSFS